MLEDVLDGVLLAGLDSALLSEEDFDSDGFDSDLDSEDFDSDDFDSEDFESPDFDSLLAESPPDSFFEAEPDRA